MSTPVEEFFNHINGEWVRSRSGRTFDNINPADTRENLGRFQASASADAEAAVGAAAAAFEGWRKTPISQRAKVLNKAADYLEANADRFGEELTREEGKSKALGRDEFLRAAQTFRFYAMESQTFGGETYPQDDPEMQVYSQREPLGVVTVISPWNFPASIPARKIAPALAMGNTVVFKPSSDAPLSGLRLTEALVQAGLPKGVLNFITGRAGDVGPIITTSRAICAISFTGSTQAGMHIQRTVHLTTRLQMELGGKNPLIVMEDADLDLAVDLAVKGGFSLTGQACTGTSRLIVVSAVKAAFTQKLLARVQQLKIGSGLTPGMDLGPLATEKQLQTVLSYIEIGQADKQGVRLQIPVADGFATGKNDIRPSLAKALDALATVLAPEQGAAVKVVGHTDSQGSEMINLQLSIARAEAVAEHLRQRGIALERLSADGRGEADPLTSNASEEGRVRNRRIELILSRQP